MEEIKAYESVFHDIQNHCTKQSERLETKAEREDMKRIMLDFATRWKDVKRSMAERRKEMERLYPVVVCYVETRTEFQTWLRQDERTLAELALESGINDMDSLVEKKNILKVCSVSIQFEVVFVLTVVVSSSVVEGVLQGAFLCLLVTV